MYEPQGAFDLRSQELTMGRTFGVNFDHGDDFFPALDEFFKKHDVSQGYITSFIAGLSEVDIVGACTELDDPNAPVWSRVRLTNVEAFGSGTFAREETTGEVHPHIHVSVGLKAYSATAHTSHLLSAKVQFLTEMLVVEVKGPKMHRRRHADLYDVPLLHFENE